MDSEDAKVLAVAVAKVSSSRNAVPDTPVLITGLVSVALVRVLFVKVCVPVKVVTVLSIARVTTLPVAELSRPVPPDTVNVSLSKSIAIVPLSVVMSKSSAVICVST